MKNNKLHYIFLTFLTFLLISVSTTQAQVTIGSDKRPLKGALLDLKEYDTEDAQSVNGSSATKGLGMPRVELTVINQLFPMFEGLKGTDTYFIGAEEFDKAEQDLKHTGLTVYNLTESISEGLEKGVYFWDGSRWTVAGRQAITGLKFFYMPSVDISFSATGNNFKVNLYEQYRKQFTKTDNSTFVSSDNTIETVPAPANGILYLPSQLSYAVTYYDDKVMRVNSISSTGEMDYDILSIKTTAASYINIVFIIK